MTWAQGMPKKFPRDATLFRQQSWWWYAGECLAEREREMVPHLTDRVSKEQEALDQDGEPCAGNASLGTPPEFGCVLSEEKT